MVKPFPFLRSAPIPLDEEVNAVGKNNGVDAIPAPEGSEEVIVLDDPPTPCQDEPDEDEANGVQVQPQLVVLVDTP